MAMMIVILVIGIVVDSLFFGTLERAVRGAGACPARCGEGHDPAGLRPRCLVDLAAAGGR